MEREKFFLLLFICENKKRNGIKNIFYPFYRQVYDNIYSVFGMQEMFFKKIIMREKNCWNKVERQVKAVLNMNFSCEGEIAEWKNSF